MDNAIYPLNNWSQNKLGNAPTTDFEHTPSVFHSWVYQRSIGSVTCTSCSKRCSWASHWRRILAISSIPCFCSSRWTIFSSRKFTFLNIKRFYVKWKIPDTGKSRTKAEHSWNQGSNNFVERLLAANSMRDFTTKFEFSLKTNIDPRSGTNTRSLLWKYWSSSYSTQNSVLLKKFLTYSLPAPSLQHELENYRRTGH